MLIGLFLYVSLSHVVLIVIEKLRFLPVTQHYRPYWLYFISFVVIIGGLITYFWHSTRKIIPFPPLLESDSFFSTAEEQGVLDPKPPTYVDARSTPRSTPRQQNIEEVEKA